MGILRTGLYAVAGIAALGVGGMFALGQSSQGGSAPGRVDGRLAPCPSSPNCVSSEEGTEESKVIAPLPLESWDDLPTVLEAKGATITDWGEEYIAAEFTSSVFGFVDDVEFRLAEDAVHVRSASRVGESDLGANAKRVAELRAALVNA